jgi:predicted DNA-binding transcriptional regulator AlpA
MIAIAEVKPQAVDVAVAVTSSTVTSSRKTPEPCIAILTAQELSRIVPLHPVTILRWAREGRIPHRRLSARKVIFLLPEINEWLASGSSLYSEPATRAA